MISAQVPLRSASQHPLQERTATASPAVGALRRSLRQSPTAVHGEDQSGASSCMFATARSESRGAHISLDHALRFSPLKGAHGVEKSRGRLSSDARLGKRK